MADAVPDTPEVDESIECGTCGKVGGTFHACGICGGHAQNQSRAYTLSEVRSGQAPDDDRYGNTGSVGPKIVTLPGSSSPH